MMSSFQHEETLDLSTFLYNHGRDSVKLGEGDGDDLSGPKPIGSVQSCANAPIRNVKFLRLML
jgi:hypothetical protein